MGVELDDDEVWAFLAGAHTAIVTTNRADGWPMAVPVWLVVEDRAIFIRKAAGSATVRRISRDPRVCVTVETGDAWVDLKAVVVLGEAAILLDEPTLDRVEDLLSTKYAGYRRDTPAAAAVERHYNRANAAIRITPTHPFVSWDNHKVRSH
jgi:PPOX class probable F420-dependent enzyme